MREWRADGVRFGDIGGGRGPGRARNDRPNKAYARSAHSTDVEGAEDSHIDALVNERGDCKTTRDFEKADSIRNELQTKFNVLIDDRLREWSVGGDFGEEHNNLRDIASAFNNRGYEKSATSKQLSPEDEEVVKARLEVRSQAKKDRDFTTADEIREELAAGFDVVIQDKLKQWSVGGDFGADGGPRKPLRGVYTRRGGGDLSEEDLESINIMLQNRTAAKKDRDFDTADEIRSHLIGTYSLSIDDKAMEWRVDSGVFVQVSEPGTKELSPENIETISAKLAERMACKLDKNYEAADAIRYGLERDFRVSIDDKNKEWKCMLPAGEGASVAESSA
jgi:cysteinyl-tRNA synthetase